jgi:DNA-binding beta-propeller fold protein YncE
MSTAAARPEQPSRSRRRHLWLLALGLPLLVGFAVWACSRWPVQEAPAAAADEPEKNSKDPPADKPDKTAKDTPADKSRVAAPELEGGVGWLNTAGPVRLKDLRGKIVLLDFWTYCCINCIHTLPELAKLERKYANQLVVIGVHSAKFDEERESDHIRKAVLRYEISHPVVNDAEMKIWQTYGAESWPTLVLIDPEGYIVGWGSGEGLSEALDKRIAELVEVHRKKKTLDEKPRRFELARFQERGDSPLFFPGKVLADAATDRLFIADSTHHRIVITNLDGKKIAVAGIGTPGAQDGPFDKAGFNDPQGMALRGDTLFVADCKNHLIRALDLKTQTVKTVAGTGKQGEDRFKGGEALKTGLSSPWDLCLKGDTLYIAQAGTHQIWTLDLAKGMLDPYAGNGRENIVDGSLDDASFAQPSGLTSDGTTLYVADSEGSAVRAVPTDGKGEVKTLVGKTDGFDRLFTFGDVDGPAGKALLQHALGIVFHDGKLYVADTYNSKIKVLDPGNRTCTTFAGGEPDGWLAAPLFSEPAGISAAGGKLYVADTNAHRIRVVDLKTRVVSTLVLQGVEAPKPPAP